MIYRRLGRTDMKVSASSFGAWAIGGFWGAVDDEESMRALHAAVDAGVNFFDTADVYGDGRSERLLARLRRECPGEQLWIATKAGRQLPVQSVAGYSRENLTGWVDASLARLEMDALDLLQLHCPHPDVFDSAEVFGILDDLIVAGKLRYYGVSVETVDEGMRALAHPGVQSVQIIFNLFRQKPTDAFFTRARACDVGIIARVPLASGLLTGKLRADSTFADDDHRQFNRNGELFDKGETFSGVPLDAAFAAVDQLRPLVPAGWTMAQFALAWILTHPEVTCAIPGAKTVAQAMDNAAAGDLPHVDARTLTAAREIYEKQLRPIVHEQW